MVQLNHNTHRLSIEWSRVEPQENEWDEAAVARYPEMLEDLRKRSIEPTVALHHFSTPLWLAQKGGGGVTWQWWLAFGLGRKVRYRALA